MTRNENIANAKRSQSNSWRKARARYGARYNGKRRVASASRLHSAAMRTRKMLRGAAPAQEQECWYTGKRYNVVTRVSSSLRNEAAPPHRSARKNAVAMLATPRQRAQAEVRARRHARECSTKQEDNVTIPLQWRHAQEEVPLPKKMSRRVTFLFFTSNR